MADELHHECGIAALYCMDKSYTPAGDANALVPGNDVTPLMPRMLLNLQNRGQLAAGLSSYDPTRLQLLDTFKDIGNVAEAFRMSHPDKHKAILKKYAGRAAIGHVRYATCGQENARYAQPFERHHGRRWKWFSFAFNGNLSNYRELREKLLSKRDYHFTLDTDTEIIMHELSYRLRGDVAPDLPGVIADLSKSFDGAYNIAFLDANGRMFVSRDPLGLRPLSYGVQGTLFGAASESVALTNLGFTDVKSLEPGEAIIVDETGMQIVRYAESKRKAHCFFEWVYFSNVASEMDNRGVYQVRAHSGEQLAKLEDICTKDGNSIVVPVPDTAKAAADSYAYHMGIPCMEGLMRNRYVGRTFIQGAATRGASVKNKYTPIPSILRGKRVFLVDDSIVRSTTMRSLVDHIRKAGGAAEVHVRVACPPIIAPCFYGIDMSTLGELFAPAMVKDNYDGTPCEDTLAKMAEVLGLDSIRYLTVPGLEDALGKTREELCLGCVLGEYPSQCGTDLYCAAKVAFLAGISGRTYE